MNVRRKLLLVAAHLPYGPIARLLDLLYRSLLIQKTLFGKRRRRFVQVFDEIGSTGDRRIAFARHLGCNLPMPWRVSCLSRARRNVFDRWVQINGLEHLQQARNSRRAVIIANSHLGAARMVTLALLRQGYELSSIEHQQHYLKKMHAQGTERLHVLRLDKNSGFWLKELYQANKVLESFGLLHWVVDGLIGNSGSGERNFHGRRRAFLRSFAEVGVKTHALILPIFSTIDNSGVIQITFLPPLNPGAARVRPADQSAAVESIITQYMALLEQQWQVDLGSVVQLHLFNFLQWPKVESKRK